MKDIIAFKTKSGVKGRKGIVKINEYVNNFNFDCEFERKIEQEPETFYEILDWVRNRLIEKDFIWYGDKLVELTGEEFWFKGILFKSDQTLSIKDSNDNIRVIMCGIEYPLMWQIIKNLTKGLFNENKI